MKISGQLTVFIGLAISLHCLTGLVLYGQAISPYSPKNLYLERELQPTTLNDKKWEQLTRELDYKDREIKRKSKKKVEKEKPFNWLEPAFLKSLWKGLKIFSFAVIALLVAWVVFLIIRSQSGPKEKKVVYGPHMVDLDKVEDTLLESDIDYWIEAAIQNQQYQVAVRLLYLRMLKSLASRKMIQWQKNKTNRQYLNELTSNPLRTDFNRLTWVFERVWYGEMELKEMEFNVVQTYFDEFEKTL